MGRTVLCFVVGPGWIRYCEKPGISLPSPPYCPAMCEPSSEEADHLSLETGGDRGKSPQNPNDGEVVLYELFQYLIKNCISIIMEHRVPWSGHRTEPLPLRLLVSLILHPQRGLFGSLRGSVAFHRRVPGGRATSLDRQIRSSTPHLELVCRAIRPRLNRLSHFRDKGQPCELKSPRHQASRHPSFPLLPKRRAT